MSTFKPFIGTWSLSQTGTLKTKLLSEDPNPPMLVKKTRKDSLVKRGENSPAPEIYTPLYSTGVMKIGTQENIVLSSN